MIVGKFYNGSGLGNQLFRYVTTRSLAMDKGKDWGMAYIDDLSGKQPGFKGTFFLNQPPIIELPTFSEWQEKKVIENGVDIRPYDPDINFIKDDTIIDGEFQDQRYWGHHLPDIDEWLAVEPYEVSHDTCIIGFRGGEYTLFPDLFLTGDYWDAAIARMREINPDMVFKVHTDDVATAKVFFPEFECIHDMSKNWRAIRSAKYSIIANSSFFILPRLLRHMDGYAYTIAPRYWARRNTQTWALPQNYYPTFFYV